MTLSVKEIDTRLEAILGDSEIGLSSEAGDMIVELQNDLRPHKPENRQGMLCASCGNGNVSRDAWADWCNESQDWILGQVFDDAFCDFCDASVKVASYDLDKPLQLEAFAMFSDGIGGFTLIENYNQTPEFYDISLMQRIEATGEIIALVELDNLTREEMESRFAELEERFPDACPEKHMCGN